MIDVETFAERVTRNAEEFRDYWQAHFPDESSATYNDWLGRFWGWTFNNRQRSELLENKEH